MKIIKITAMWCPSCLIMNDIFSSVEEDIEVISYDYDLDEDIVNSLNVGKILPVLIKLDENDNEIGRLIGEHSKKEVEEFLKR